MVKNNRGFLYFKSLQTFHTWYRLFRDQLGNEFLPLWFFARTHMKSWENKKKKLEIALSFSETNDQMFEKSENFWQNYLILWLKRIWIIFVLKWDVKKLNVIFRQKKMEHFYINWIWRIRTFWVSVGPLR